MTLSHGDYLLSELDVLESESIHIMREVAAEFERPVLLFSGGKDSIGPPGDFPSGGAARALITFGLLARLLGEQWDSPAERMTLWGIALGLVAAQGGSRLYLGRHWPEDILGGWLFGWLILRTLGKTADLTRPA